MELEVYQAMGRRIKEPLLHLHSSQSVLGNMSQISTMFPILDVDGSSKAPENRRSSPQQKTVWRRAGVQGSCPLKRHDTIGPGYAMPLRMRTPTTTLV